MNNEIRTSRMANITLSVVSADKTPLSNREVIIVNQTGSLSSEVQIG